MSSVVTRRELLLDSFNHGVWRCQPQACLLPYLPMSPPAGRTLVLGAGKAAASMASVVHDALDYPVEGLVVTRYGHDPGQPTGGIRVIEAGHPVPDESSESVAREMLALAGSVTADDRVLFLVSGGGSALLLAPIDGVKLDKKQEITRHLLASGAPIEVINFIRKHLSRIKGGGLSCAAAAASQMTFVISDVVGDRPDLVASGPSLPFEREPARAIALLEAYGWKVDPPLAEAIHKAREQQARPHDVFTIATGQQALSAIQHRLSAQGYEVMNLGSEIDGDAGDAALLHARLMQDRLPDRPLAIVSGGEVTVEVKATGGRGGRNLEFLAALMQAVPEGVSYTALACDSDGIDGTEENAGAFLDSTSRRRAVAMGLDIESLRSANDTYAFFSALDDLVTTGPTGTNVNDIRIILVD